MRELNLSKNYIEKLENIDNFTNLFSLEIEMNFIKKIDIIKIKNNKLKKLNLGNNLIDNLKIFNNL